MKTIKIILLTVAMTGNCAFAAKAKENNKSAKTVKQIEHPRKPASIKADEFAVFIDKQYKIVKTKKLDGMVVNAECTKAKPCEALAALKKTKVPLSSGKNPAKQHPAAHHCVDLGGKNLIVINSKGDDENLCRFSDNSYINSWDLYYKHFPKTVIK